MSGSWLLALAALALFGTLVLVGLELARTRVRVRRLAAELGVRRDTTANRLSALGTRATQLAERALTRYDQEGRLGRALERAGIDMRPAEFAAIAALVVAAATLWRWCSSGHRRIAVAIIVPTAFRAVVTAKGRKRRDQFEEQLGDTLQLIAGGLRAGHSLPQAIDALAQEAESPTREEFQRVLFETQLGHTLPEHCARSRSESAARTSSGSSRRSRSSATSVATSPSCSTTSRARSATARGSSRQIKALTAEGRLSAVILFCLPIVMFGWMLWANDSYMTELTSSGVGIGVLVAGGTLLVVGGIWLRRIVRLDF